MGQVLSEYPSRGSDSSMNWLQRTSQNMIGSPPGGMSGVRSVSDILTEALRNQLTVEDYHGQPGAVTQIRNIAGVRACEEVQAFGVASSEANSIASTIMRALECEGYPDAPGAQNQQQMLTPESFPALGEQERPPDMPSAEIA